MNIQLSPKSYANSKQHAGNKPLQTFVSEILEAMFAEGSVYMIFNPAPSPERLDAVKAFVQGIRNSEEFYGFTFLTKAEAEQMRAIRQENYSSHLLYENEEGKTSCVNCKVTEFKLFEVKCGGENSEVLTVR